MTTATPGWQSGVTHCSSPRGSKRALEIVGIVIAFFWFWPAAAAYIVWKVMGYPVPVDVKRWFDGSAGQWRFRTPSFDDRSWAGGPWAGTGNAAFDEYRRGELERLERERRRLDEEAREFRDFVEELKRAKDREEFDAYMAKRRANGQQTA